MRKKIFLICIFTVIFLTSYAQSQSIEKYDILKAGTQQLINGQCEIPLTVKTDTDLYYVILTPLDEYTGLFIASKKEDTFTVKSGTGADVKFDFIIIIKKPEKKLSPEFEINKKRR